MSTVGHENPLECAKRGHLTYSAGTYTCTQCGTSFSKTDLKLYDRVAEFKGMLPIMRKLGILKEGEL